jgi:glycosyltransferase involved in cell wall biosynthesis
LTDAWFSPANPIGKLAPIFRERFHRELSTARVYADNSGVLRFELLGKMTGSSGWPLIRRRNSWFQKWAVSQLSRFEEAHEGRTVFAFSYAARDIFRLARARGWRTVLGQIDPGPPEERIVGGLYGEEAIQRGDWERAPPRYWRDWREECELADRIVVNSSWSQRALAEEGIPQSKLRIVPLAYEAPAGAENFRRQYPEAFTMARPLRVLFLGSICVRKGVRPLFDAIRLLKGQPVEFWFVGPLQVPIPPDLRGDPQVRWIGARSRGETAEFYRNADVFVFPTFSDGFGLTQLEAQAWKLPVIATRNCGDVVENERNGWLLPEPTGMAIAATIRSCLARPEILSRSSANAVLPEKFGLVHVGQLWLDVLN